MKNKKTVYLLGLLVLVIWGIVIYHVFDIVSDHPEPLTSRAPVAKEPYDDYALPKDTTRLKGGYRDPFGLTPAKDTIAPGTKKMIVRNKQAAPIVSGINWGIIRYLGYIRNPGSKRLIAILHINGKEVMMAEGESAEQVKLLRNMRDSVKVTYQGKTKFITIKPVTL